MEWLHILYNLTGAGLLALLGMRLLRRRGWLGLDLEDPLHGLPAVYGLVMAQIMGWVLLLGYTDHLSEPVVVWGQSLISTLGILGALMGRERRREHLAILRAWRRHAREGWMTMEPLPRATALFLVTALACMGCIAAASTPLIVDSQVYRLPRISMWLQQGSLAPYFTQVERQNFFPINGDLVFLWYLSHFEHGYRGLALVQFSGLPVLILVMLGFSRRLGWSAPTRVFTVVLLLGSGLVSMQAMSTQTDLLTTALLTAGIYLLYESLRRRAFSVLPAVMVALAVGTKSTAYLAGPGLLLAFVLWCRAERPRRTWLMLHAFALSMAFLVFAAHRHFENLNAYGNPFGPDSYLERHNSPINGPGDLAGKTALNAAAYLVQNLDIRYIPPGLKEPARKAAQSLAEPFPDAHRHMFLKGVSQSERLKRFFSHVRWDSDSAVPGPWIVLLAGVALPFCILRFLRKPGDQRLALEAGLALVPPAFFLLFSATGAWSLFQLRFSLLAVPFAVLGIGCLFERLRRRPCIYRGLTGLFGGLSAYALVAATTTGIQTGTTNLMGGPPVLPPSIQEAHQHLLEEIFWEEPSRPVRLGVVATENSPLSGWLRKHPPVALTYLPLESVLRAGTPNAFLDSAGFDVLILPTGVFVPESLEANLPAYMLIDYDYDNFYSHEVYFGKATGLELGNHPVLYRSRSHRGEDFAGVTLAIRNIHRSMVFKLTNAGNFPVSVTLANADGTLDRVFTIAPETVLDITLALSDRESLTFTYRWAPEHPGTEIPDARPRVYLDIPGIMPSYFCHL